MKMLSKKGKRNVGDVPEETAPPKKKKKGKAKWIVLAILLIIVILIAVWVIRIKNAVSEAVANIYTTVSPENRDIVSSLSDSGVLQPADSYNVTTLVSGDILSCGFEEGDIVEKDDVLYEIDDSDARTGIESAESSVTSAQLQVQNSQLSYAQQQDSLADQREDLGKLVISAPVSGQVSNVSIEVGDDLVNGSVIATVTSVDTVELTQHISSEYRSNFYTGMAAQVTVSGQNMIYTGSVTDIYDDKYSTATGMECFTVVVTVNNQGALSEAVTGICTFTAGGETVYAVEEAAFKYAASRTITCQTMGTVEQVYIREGSRVNKGDTVALLSGDDIDDYSVQTAYISLQGSLNSLENAQTSLENAKDALDDYVVTAPIEGTIVDKYYKEGETSEAGKVMCIIYDLSSLTVTLDVDELDINQVAVGQSAEITADAVEGKTYNGVVTRVGVNGTAANGVTTYPVEIRIDMPDGLLPGMNVDVSIIVGEKSSVLAIPADAVERGNRVLVVTDEIIEGNDAPAGYKYVDVQTGISDDDYVEITSGLTVSDVVAYIPATAQGTDIFTALMTEGGGAGGVYYTE